MEQGDDERPLGGDPGQSQQQPASSEKDVAGPSSSQAPALSHETEGEAGRKRSSRIGKMETKKREEDERRAREEEEAQRKAEEKRLARLRRKQERAAAGLGEEDRCAQSFVIWVQL